MPEILYYCHGCKENKPSSEFYSNSCRSTGLSSLCKPCDTIYNRKRTRIVREAVLSHYGNKCVCCGETTFEFLAIDHINNDGTEQRKKYGMGMSFIRYIIRIDYPKDLQILCHNCNNAKGFYGECPHAKKRREGDLSPK